MSLVQTVFVVVFLTLAACILVAVFIMLRDRGKIEVEAPSGFTQRRDGAERDYSSDDIPAHGLVLAGFDDEYATPVRIDMTREKLADRRYGFSVGRHPDLVDAVLDHPDVSRRHARFFWRAGRFQVEDLNSSHGTWVRDERLQPFRPVDVRPGDEILLGKLKMDLGR